MGRRFAKAVGTLIRRILQNPELSPLTKTGARRAVLRDFPYTIHYQIEPEQIVVFAIFHAKRNPRDLRSRKRNI